jgi:hypothetical protein
MASKKFLQDLEIEVSETGFVLWITEVVENKRVRHWLLDGSEVKEDGIIRLGSKYNIKASINDNNNSVIITKKKR